MKKPLLLMLLLCANFAFSQQPPSIPVSVDFPQIAIGGDAAGANYATLLQVVNNNSVPTTGHVVLYANDGSRLAAVFDGQGPQTSIDIPLAAGQAREIRLTASGPVTAGWMEITYS